jgi:hypothetical protein
MSGPGLAGGSHRRLPSSALVQAKDPEETMGRYRNKAGGPTRGRLRVKKMGMGSGRARARARASLRAGKRG